MTNAVDANEVQGNVVTVKEGKKRVIEAITSEEVAQRNRQRMPVNIRIKSYLIGGIRLG